MGCRRENLKTWTAERRHTESISVRGQTRRQGQGEIGDVRAPCSILSARLSGLICNMYTSAEAIWLARRVCVSCGGEAVCDLKKSRDLHAAQR